MSLSRETLNYLTLPNVPNYVPTATAAGTFGCSTLISMLDCGSTSFYTNALLTLAFTGLAANQYGWAKSAALASNMAGQAKSSVMGLFKQAAVEENNQAEEEVKSAPRSARR